MNKLIIVLSFAFPFCLTACDPAAPAPERVTDATGLTMERSDAELFDICKVGIERLTTQLTDFDLEFRPVIRAAGQALPAVKLDEGKLWCALSDGEGVGAGMFLMGPSCKYNNESCDTVLFAATSKDGVLIDVAEGVTVGGSE